nr:uncharacterized mitochondrial protein AtMg00810-like [Tanacetum cinerariifolium]
MYCLVVTDDYSRFSWVFFLAKKDKTSGILKDFITGIENQLNHKVKIIRCDNETEFKNYEMNQFYGIKGIKRKFSNARTPRQNRVAKRKNRTLIEAARTMLADLLLPIPFWAEAVNTACYVQNRAFRVYNSRTKKVEENLHVNFLENKPNVAGSGLEWLFDIDSLTNSMNYQPVSAGNRTNVLNTSSDVPLSNEEVVSSPKDDAGKKSTIEPTCVKGGKIDDLGFNAAGSSFSHLAALDDFFKIPNLEETRIFDDAYDDRDEGAEADYNYLETMEPKKVTQALENEIWVETMQEELFKFKLLNVWTLVDLPHGKRAIETKWVYVSQPAGFMDPEFPDRVYKVEKALYGLYQAPRAWYETLSNYLLENRFRRGTIDKTLFIKKIKNDILLVQVYVDDTIFGSTKRSLSTKFEQLMHNIFEMSSMGELTFFLGLHVEQRKDGIFLSQDKYVCDILKKFGFSSVKSASTPMETHKHLSKDSDGTDVDVHLYWSMIGLLTYLTFSRPDIMFAVCACSRFQVQPKVSHMHAVKRIFRYLKGQPTLGLWYPKDSPLELIAYSDSDYAGASLDRKSTTGGYNESAICVVKNQVYHSKTKHSEIRHHFIRDSYEKRLIEMVKIHIDSNVADLLTKAFDMSSSKTVNYVKQIHVIVDGKAVVISESLVISDLFFDDEDGITCLTNDEIFENLALMGYEPLYTKLTFQKGSFSPQWKFLIHTILHCISSKSTSWNEFSTNLASAVICLAKGQKFNFSKLIFDGMLRNTYSKKFLMYPRFLQLFLNNQLHDLPEIFNDTYETPCHTKKVFSNMARKNVHFSRNVTLLFNNMLVQNQAPEGEGSAIPPKPQPTPSISQPLAAVSQTAEAQTVATLIPESQIPESQIIFHETHIEPTLQSPTTYKRQRKTHKRRRTQKATVLPQTSVSQNLRADEAVNQEEGDRVERAITTDASLEAAQDSDNIIKTQTMAMPNVDIPYGIDTGGSPRSQETMGGHTSGSEDGKLEDNIKLTDTVPTPHDSPLTGGYIPESDEGMITLVELMETCTTLSNRVTQLENKLSTTKAVYNKSFITLTNRVKKLEFQLKQKRSNAVIHSSDEEGPSVHIEDSPKQERIIKEMDKDKNNNLQKREQENIPKGDQAKEIDWNDPQVLRYHALQNRTFSKAKVRKNMIIYLKNQGGYKQSYFKGMKYEDIRPLFERIWDQVHTFVPKNYEIEKEVMKRVGFDLQQGSSKKQRVTQLENKLSTTKAVYNKSFITLTNRVKKLEFQLKQKRSNAVIHSSDEEGPKTLLNIKRSLVKEVKISTYHIIRGDKNTRRYTSMINLLENIDREDLETLWKLVKDKYGNTRLEEGYERVLWEDLKVMFVPDIESEVWRFKSLYIFVLVDKVYPLTLATINMMLERKLHAEQWNEMCYQLLKLLMKQLRKQ